jgi:hypothetical protein
MNRTVSGTVLGFSGTLLVIVGSVWNIANLEDEGPRCLSGCSASLLQYYWGVFEASTLVIVAGVLLVIAGTRLVIKQKRREPENRPVN